MKKQHEKKPISDKALREALRTLGRPLRFLPESWWDQEARERMGEWIKRFKESEQ